MVSILSVTVCQFARKPIFSHGNEDIYKRRTQVSQRCQAPNMTLISWLRTARGSRTAADGDGARSSTTRRPIRLGPPLWRTIRRRKTTRSAGSPATRWCRTATTVSLSTEKVSGERTYHVALGCGRPELGPTGRRDQRRRLVVLEYEDESILNHQRRLEPVQFHQSISYLRRISPLRCSFLSTEGVKDNADAHYHTRR